MKQKVLSIVIFLLLFTAFLQAQMGAKKSVTLSMPDAVAAAMAPQGTDAHLLYQFSLAWELSTVREITAISFTPAGDFSSSDILKYYLLIDGGEVLEIDPTTPNSLHTFYFPLNRPYTIDGTDSADFEIRARISSTATEAGYIYVRALAINNISLNSGSVTLGTPTPIDSGYQTFSHVSLATDSFRTVFDNTWITSINWSSAASWESKHANTGDYYPATSIPDSLAFEIIIQTGHTLTADIDVSASYLEVQKQSDQSIGKLIVEQSKTLILEGIGSRTDMRIRGEMQVYGTFQNNNGSIVQDAGSSLSFGNRARYIHNCTLTTGTIPTASWHEASNCEIVGITNLGNAPGGLNQNFGNFIWNCPAQAYQVLINNIFSSIQGSFELKDTGDGSLKIEFPTQNITINGDFRLSGGTLYLAGTTTNNNPKFIVKGDTSITYGSIQYQGTGAGHFVFDGTLNKKISIADGFVFGNNIQFTVNPNRSLEFADENSVIKVNSGGMFKLESASTLIIRHPEGLGATNSNTGCIQLGNHVFHADAAFCYTGNRTIQVTGEGLPVSIAKLEFRNPNSTKLSKDVSISSELKIISNAIFDANGKNITLAGNLINSGTFNASTATLKLTGTGSQNIGSFSGNGTFEMAKTGGTATMTGAFSTSKLWMNGNGGTLNLGTSLTHTVTNTWTRTLGTLNGGSSTLRLGGSVNGDTGFFDRGTGTVNYYANGTQTMTNVYYYNLTISGSGSKKTASGVASVTIYGTLCLQDTATFEPTPSYQVGASLSYVNYGPGNIGNEWPATMARSINIDANSTLRFTDSKTGFTGTLSNYGKLISGEYQLSGTIQNYGILAAQRTDIMATGSLAHETGSTLDYTIPLTIPANSGYKNLTLSASGRYYLSGALSNIAILHLPEADTYLFKMGNNLGYSGKTGNGHIVDGLALFELGSENPAYPDGNVLIGTDDNPAYRFTLEPIVYEEDNGNLPTVYLQDLPISILGHFERGSVSYLNLWHGFSEDFSDATPYSSRVIGDPGNYTFSNISNCYLSVIDTNYFWLTADISGSAILGQDFYINSLPAQGIVIDNASFYGTTAAGGYQTLSSLVAYPATAICHNGFTAHWNSISDAGDYQIKVFDSSDELVYRAALEPSDGIFRVEGEDIREDRDYYYYLTISPSQGIVIESNHIALSTTAEIPGVSASTTIRGNEVTINVPPIADLDNNDVHILPRGFNDSSDYHIVLSYHPEGYAGFANGRLLATITATNPAALNATFIIHHETLPYTPAAMAFRYNGAWTEMTGFSANENYSEFTISGIGGRGSGTLEVLSDDGSGTLPVVLSSFNVALNSRNQAVLTWVTQTESGLRGFNVYRNSVCEVASAALISPLIPATNSSQMQVYAFTDGELSDEGRYYYWLEINEMDGSQSYSGAIYLDYHPEYHSGTNALPIQPGFANIYPNPFNLDATIKYCLAKDEHSQIKVYNQRGQLVRTLDLGQKAAGYHNLAWDAKDEYGQPLSSGLYFFHLQTGAKSYIKKAVLLK